MDSSGKWDRDSYRHAHGHAGDIPNGDGSYGIPLDAASRAELDYMALGHWHSTNVFSSARIGVFRYA